ncbi:MAG TPA: alpha/beta fold hydrolase [Tepidisphaeraceae bacterium]
MANHSFTWRHGEIHYAKKGLGEPIVLIHNIYPGADHQEFEHNLDELARHFTVYAPDLLGFGDSDAPWLKYTADVYIDLIGDFLRDVVTKPATIISAGLSCAYVTDVAVAQPERVDRLIFVCPRSEPTGLDSPRWFAPLRRLFLTTPPLGSGFYDTMAGEAEMGLFLRNCFYSSRGVTPQLVERLCDNARRPGSIHPYASLVTGYLDRHLLASLPRVEHPILLVWGRHAHPTPVEHSVRLLALARNSRLEIIDRAGGWPHYEQSATFNRLLIDYLREPAPEPATTRAAS